MDSTTNSYVEIERTPTQVIRISLDDFKGKSILNIRVWVLKDGKWIPTKRGINLYPHEIASLEKAIQRAKEDLELTDPDTFATSDIHESL